MKNIFVLIFLVVFLFCPGFSQDNHQEFRSVSPSSYEFLDYKKLLAQNFKEDRRSSLRGTNSPSQQGDHSFPGEGRFFNAHYPFPPVTANASNGVEEAWVSHYGSGLIPGHDSPTGMATDGQGNIYITGYSPGLPFGRDYLTIKYDANGTEVWSVRYSEGVDNVATAIAVDMFGNVIVTGQSWDSETSYDYATVMYSSSGVQQWVARYNGPGNLEDGANALAIDAAGNVCVTGVSWDFGTNFDYATVQYNFAGVEQWVARYNGTGNHEDEAGALAIDASGNVYVTGYSTGLNGAYDYATVKYNSSGVQQWAARYQGQGIFGNRAKALAVDASGNVYVTGESEGTGGHQDYATVKYNIAGVEQWVVRYNGPGNSFDSGQSLVVDASENIYVAGGSVGFDGHQDYATVKYNTAGVEQWVVRYNGPGNSGDAANALAVDASGNVYVTGNSWGSGTFDDYATVKYDSSGLEQWVTRYNNDNFGDLPEALIVDVFGNVYVTGGSGDPVTRSDYATVKYNSAGVEEWVTRYSGVGTSFDEAKALTVDASGNVYVTGDSEDPDGYEDYVTVSYNAAGVEQWAARYDGGPSDYAKALAVDASGNVYVTGESVGFNTYYDYVIVKYNASGIEQWVARYNDPTNNADRAEALAVDGIGNVYVTGYSQVSLYMGDYVTLKYNSAGEQQWLARYNGPGNGDDWAKAIAVDASGNVYVTGFSAGLGTSFDYATIKYNSMGVEQWVARYNGQLNDYDAAEALAVDGSGNVYVTGNTYYEDYATVKYNAAGVEQWAVTYDGGLSDFAKTLAVDVSGNVYVTGDSYNSIPAYYDFTTVKYNSSGEEQWVARYDGGTGSSEYVKGLAIDTSGNVYVTGASRTVKYNSNGEEQWVALFNAGQGNAANALAVDASGNVYVSGSSAAPGQSVYTTIKYIQTPTGVVEAPMGLPEHYQLLQNYPNPFNPSTTIRYGLPVGGQVTLKIYDVLGREILTLADKQQREVGFYETEVDMRNYGSGLYFYRLIVEGQRRFREVKKMLLVK